ncbi:DUF4350 domain-containing protein [uncultured Thiohalocapsa sp.]|uniref:DUF4350 domain-containing protein n=1 Tax=uncultured Thiohalocapsa sp. TaxID=768990 RepID=UPI0025EE43B9|nr:DUF4350 domain-containing protein [uncultured Thiohalocapsa sp.]
MAEPRRHRASSGAAWVLWVVGAVLALGGWLWFTEHFERRVREVPTGASAQARANPFLAAERFLTASGVDARSDQGRTLLRQLPGAADMIIIDGLPVLNAARRERLHAWLSAGGHLLVEAVHLDGDADRSQETQFLTRFGAVLRRDAAAASTDEVVAELRLPDQSQPLRIAFEPTWYLEDRHGRAVGEASADGRARLIIYAVGAGRLIVVSDTEWLRNTGIGAHDHALALALLTANRDAVRLLHDVSVPSLPALLWRTAPAAVVSAALLLVLLLWHLGRRLGPLLPAPDTGRRDLLEHLQAAGDFGWRHGRGGLLVAQTRRRLERRWLGRHPQLKQLDAAGRAERIAARTGLKAAQVQAALYGPVGDTAGLLHVTATLQRLARARPPAAGTAPPHTPTSKHARITP